MTGGPLVLKPLAHPGGANLTVEADIVLNGIPSGGDLDLYGNSYPVNNAVILNNYHSNDQSRFATIPGSAILIIAAVGVTIEGAVCSQPVNAQHTQCPHPNPLVFTGVDDRDFLSQDVFIQGNTGWVSAEGWVDLWETEESEGRKFDQSSHAICRCGST